MSDGSTESILEEITLPEAMEHFLQGRSVYVEWERMRLIKKDTWCELNINHLQRGKWFVRQASNSQTSL